MAANYSFTSFDEYKNMVRISVAKFGEIPQPSIDRILETINGCYGVIGEPQAELVELFVFEKSGAFFATHDALSGKPRVSIYLDLLLSLSESVGLAGIRRQAPHSVLHGSLEFYLIPFPESLLQATPTTAGICLQASPGGDNGKQGISSC